MKTTRRRLVDPNDKRDIDYNSPKFREEMKYIDKKERNLKTLKLQIGKGCI